MQVSSPCHSVRVVEPNWETMPRFVPGCGAKLGGGAPAPVVSAAVAEPMSPVQYQVEGDNLEVVRVTLIPGQEVYAEAGKMVYKTANVDWQTKMTGSGIGGETLRSAEAKADRRVALHDSLQDFARQG